MTDTVTIDPADRALWDRYVRRRWGALKGAKDAGTVGGQDAATIAAYIELRLDEWKRAAFERRLVDEPILLETLIAARAALAAPPEDAPAPQALTAFALNMGPAPTPVRAVTPTIAGTQRRRWFMPGHAFAWSVATAAFLGAFAIGAFVAWEVLEPPAIVAQSEKEKAPLKDELAPRNNSIFDDPARTIFDGMDVDE